MRITAGMYKGRVLPVPRGTSARPSLALTRRSLFDQLAHGLGVDIASAPVLDVFAGSGALGFESLSRGAPQVAFFDNDAKTLAGIRAILEKWGIGAQAELIAGDARTPPPRLNSIPPAGLALVDAPYASKDGAQAIEALAAQGWLAMGAHIVLEEAAASPANLRDDFTLLRRRAWAQTALSFWQWR